ncbi:hypothetical protein NY96_19485 [Xanthomonas citri pv. fuscans]|nr:hypothetical protein NY96_19485 [Xanthomonas citri pv. fuscans]
MSGMEPLYTENDITILRSNLERCVERFAVERRSNVSSGLETPHLAGLLVQKHARGIRDAGEVILGEAAMRGFTEAADRYVELVDPEWRRHAQERFAMKPSTVARDR